jgi:hypothetical protein
MAKINGNGLAYRSDVPEKWVDEDGVKDTTRSVYEMYVADRMVFLVSVVNADPDLQIQIGRPNAEATGKWHLSDGQAVKGLHEVPSDDGGEVPSGLVEHVDGMSLQAYVYPRLPLILVRMYKLGAASE